MTDIQLYLSTVFIAVLLWVGLHYLWEYFDPVVKKKTYVLAAVNKNTIPVYPVGSGWIAPGQCVWVGLSNVTLTNQKDPIRLLNLPFTGIKFKTSRVLLSETGELLVEFINTSDKIYHCTPDTPICQM